MKPPHLDPLPFEERELPLQGRRRASRQDLFHIRIGGGNEIFKEDSNHNIFIAQKRDKREDEFYIFRNRRRVLRMELKGREKRIIFSRRQGRFSNWER